MYGDLTKAARTNLPKKWGARSCLGMPTTLVRSKFGLILQIILVFTSKMDTRLFSNAKTLVHQVGSKESFSTLVMNNTFVVPLSLTFYF